MNHQIRNKVYTADNREVLYQTVLRCPDGIVRLYCNHWTKENRTIFRESKDGISFDSELHVVIKDSGVSHNFYPFYDKNGNLYAIGGLDSWKHEAKWRQVDDYEVFKKMFLERFKTPYIRDVERFEMFKKRIRAKKPLEHTSGLYLLKSETGVEWTMAEKDPIITAWHPGFHSALDWGKSTEFDGHLSCVYNPRLDKYVLYLRNNIRWGIRYIQYSMSDNLRDWSPFQSVNIEGYDIDTENYYSPVIWKHPHREIYVGMIPFFFEKGGKGCIKLIKSEDGINFEIAEDIFQRKVSLLNLKPKSYYNAINGILTVGDMIYFYIHHNYLGVIPHEPVEIYRYEISIRDLDKALKC